VVALAAVGVVGAAASLLAIGHVGHDLEVSPPAAAISAPSTKSHARSPVALAKPPASKAVAARPAPEPPKQPAMVLPDAPAPETAPKPEAKPEPRPVPKTPRARAELLVEDMSRTATVPGSAPIEDEFGRLIGYKEYRGEKETKLPLRLSAIVNPQDDRAPFAIIEDKDTGVVASYGEGGVLWPGVLPGVWVIDVDPGVVHLLDLKRNAFEYLTFTKPPKRKYGRRSKKRTRKRRRRR
jgi:hypothetical protein